MGKFWNRYFEQGGLERRILSRGVTLTLVPLVLVVLVTLIVQSLASSASSSGCFRLAAQDLNHTVQGLLGACKVAQEEIALSLTGAKAVLDRAGHIDFDSSHRITWKAKNQYTNQVTEIELPTLRAGSTRFLPISDFSREAPVVDEVERLFTVTATVFQRMNEHGDMLRIATTVKKASGERAIGTFIPVVGTDGKPNPVLSSVLKGKTYLGRAFVVNAWFIAAYQPMFDVHGKIVGMLYTGLPESTMRDRLAGFNAQISSAGKTDVFVLHTAAQAKGLFVLSSDKTLEGHSSWTAKDDKGKLFVQEICQKALAAKPGAISEAGYWSRPQTEHGSQKFVTRFTYFPEWDWVIGVQQPEEDFLAVPNEIKRIFHATDLFLPVFCLATAFLALRIWRTFAGRLSTHTESVIAKLKESSLRLAGVAQLVGDFSGSVAQSAQDLMRVTQSQAAATERTLAATGAVTQTASRNSETAEDMLSLSSDTGGVLQQAKDSLGAVDGAMQTIKSTTTAVLSIVASIDEICFTTNIVAVNASIEAAHAGDAGVTFGLIAGEVRSLAGKCNEAANQTKTIVNQSRVEMEHGSDLVSRLVSNLQPLGENSDKIRELASAVSLNSQQQVSSLGQVLEAMGQIQQASESSTQAAQRGVHDAASLLSQVGSLKGSVTDIDQAIEILNKEFAAE